MNRPPPKTCRSQGKQPLGWFLPGPSGGLTGNPARPRLGVFNTAMLGRWSIGLVPALLVAGPATAQNFQRGLAAYELDD